MNPIPICLTTPTTVVSALAAACRQDVPNLSFIFSPVLQWQDVAEAQRAQREMQQGTTEEGEVPDQPQLDPTQFPLLAFNRSALIPIDQRSRRNVFGEKVSVTLDDGNDTPQDWQLQLFFGMFRVHFKVFARDMLELEALELGFATHTMFSDITKITIPIPSLYSVADFGQVPDDFWSFDVTWDPLKEDALEIERRPAMVFAFQGEATIRGVFMTGGASTFYPLNTINARIMNPNEELLDSIVVTRRNA